jgi:hypothetical protein
MAFFVLSLWFGLIGNFPDPRYRNGTPFGCGYAALGLCVKIAHNGRGGSLFTNATEDAAASCALCVKLFC